MKTVGINQAMQAYADAAKQIQGHGTGAKNTVGLQSFDDLLSKELTQTIANLRAGEQQSINAAAGTADLQTVVEALSKAELSLQRVTAVRDRVIAAYEEIMRMPI